MPGHVYSSKRIGNEKFRLAEGPVWIAARDSFVFVDIEGKAVCEWRPDGTADGNGVRRIPMPDRVGFIVPIDGYCVLAGVRDTLTIVDLDSGDCAPYFSLRLDPRLRFNDGKAGPDGTLYAGVMAIDQSDPNARGMGALYVLRDHTILQILPGMTIPNGMAWSPDRGTLYHADTPTQTVSAYPIRPDGTLGEGTAMIRIPEADGAPDGLCADDAGNLWIALWGGKKVACFNPKSGERLAEIEVAGLHVSCPSFGGGTRDLMMITTGEAENEAGAIFRAELSVTGPSPFSFRLNP